MDLPNIPDIWARCKAGLEAVLGQWGLLLALFLVAFASFGLGRLSAVETAKPAISVSSAPLEADVKPMAVGGLVVASRNGSVYHFPWCGGASQINPDNRVWYASEEDAREAGYTLSKSCKGLDE